MGIKRRRTKTQIGQEREEALLREQNINMSQEQTQMLKHRVAELESTGLNNSNAAEILSNLLAQGICVQDENGGISIPSASKERPMSK